MKNSVDFWWQIFFHIFPRKNGLKFVTPQTSEKFTSFSTARKEIYHLDLALGATSRKNFHLEKTAQKRHIKVRKRPPLKAMVLVGASVSCFIVGCFRACLAWWQTAFLERPINGRRKKQINAKHINLESRAPGVDLFRASGPKWGRKWPRNGFWPCLKNGGNTARKMGKMARNSIFELFSGHFFHFPGHLSGPFFPHFSGEAKIHSSDIFTPISGRRPEMDLYQVHGIPNINIFLTALVGQSSQGQTGTRPRDKRDFRTPKSLLPCFPKDPAVLKTLWDSELLRRSVFTTPPRFTTP